MRAASKTVKRHSFIRRNFHQENGGFTIVETMIVLAITGLLFVIAFLQINGKQQETEFQQAINDVNSSLQQIINQTTTGDYQSANQIQCDGTGSAPVITPYTGPNTDSEGNPDSEGTSDQCVFVGKVIQFAAGANVDPQQYIVYPAAGLRLDNTGLDCQTVDCASPVVVAPPVPGSPVPDDRDPHFLQDGLSVVSVKLKNGAATTSVGAIGIIGSFGATSGSQQFYPVPIQNTNTNVDPADQTSDLTSIDRAVKKINNNLASSYDNIQTILNSSNPNYTVQICLASGTTNQSGLITIGGNGGDINSVQTTIFSDNNCT